MSFLKIEIGNALYAATVLFLAVAIIPDNDNQYVVLIASITLIMMAYFAYLRAKKHTIIAINTSILFWLYVLADVVSYEVSVLTVFAYLFFVFAFSFFFVLVYQEIGARVKLLPAVTVTLLSIVLYAIPVLYIVYYLSFGVYLTPDIVYAIMQTNMQEAIEFIRQYISYKWIFLILISSIALSYYLYKVEKQERHRISVLLCVGLILSTLTLALYDKTNLRIVYLLTRTMSHYSEELERFKEVQQKRKLGGYDFEASKALQGETYIVAIGESLNKHHMSLYGYMRKTTPKLDLMYSNGELLVYKNVYSNHTHTMPVLSQLLTEANQKNNRDYYDSLSIVDVLKRAGVETHWVSNQVIQGADDNLAGVIASQADQIHRINFNFGATSKTEKYDGDMVEIVDEIVSQKSVRNRVIFVHMMGSHGDYCARYPDKYQHFDNELEKEKFGLMADDQDLSQSVNCYDNSVLYNDYVVSSLINVITKINDVSGLIYLSDHADDVFNKRGHNSGMFSFNMVEIPLVMWFSDAYKNRYREKHDRLRLRQEEYYSNDLAYDSLIGIFDINTAQVEREHDLSDQKYFFDPVYSHTLHGRKSYIDRDNFYYWLPRNQYGLSRQDMADRVMPHRVNSIGKMRQVIADGVTSFEFDLMYVEDGGTGYLTVGHDLKTQSNVVLDDYLKLLPMDKVEKLWFDVKNVNQNNVRDIVEYLQNLEPDYDLKSKIIFESDMTADSFNVISDAGFHTSYYLPGDLARLYRKNKHSELEIRVGSLLRQIENQRCSAISFDISLYPFVKEYLEAELDDNIVYHTWDLSMEMRWPEFTDELQKNNYYKDKRVKTVLVRYYSEYDL